MYRSKLTILPAREEEGSRHGKLTGGQQFLVIAAGGHPKVTEEKQTDEIVAFSLP